MIPTPLHANCLPMPFKAALAAGREVIARTRYYLDQCVSFAVETTLAGSGPLETMRRAKRPGFKVRLIYVALDSPERNIQRVRERVTQGGHGVPNDDVRRRYIRSLENLPEALKVADSAVVYDNSGPFACKVLEARDGIVTWVADPPPEWLLHLG